MNYFDIIIIIPLLWGAFKGFKKGLVIELASIVALVLGVWGGIKFASVSAKYLGEMFDISVKIMPLISFAVTFLLIVIVVFALAKLLERFIKMTSIGFVNKLVGAVFGTLKFGLIISIIINLVNNINEEITVVEPEMKNTSLLYQPISKIALIVFPGIKEINLKNMTEDKPVY
ncbi:MAG: hypothetical protein A3K10_10140 [Bacteroidetes bacterium RIFCSPLOWO2_12_FULL_31_6]|nr:MAG: hypothetical protein A3K10_10140 [Bacteroidetes bacterium RIFCSPLOWO2_12_FULL_31_6]